MSTLHVVGIAIALFAIITVSIYSIRMAKEKKGANSWVVAGAIMGTLVGGSSTVGTAQLAYQYGMSAWWFTLGSGIACLVLAIVYAKPFHKSGNKTLVSFITKEYGTKNGLIASIFSSFGSFINIISQLISATAIIAVISPDLHMGFALLFSSVFMILYVIFGGTKGSGMVGILKMILLYLTMISAGLIVLFLSNGVSGFSELVSSIDNHEKINFYSLFARGIGKDLGACLSLILGVITTQTYAQAIIMADRTCSGVRGALLSAALIPPVGFGGILVGLYMRATHPDIASKTALTFFVTEYMPPLLGGIVLGALFIAVIGTGAGLALGIAINLKNDVLPLIKLDVKKVIPEKFVEKILIVILLFVACFLSMGPLGDTILSFAFMSMGLRGATIFMPLCFALWCPVRIPKIYAGLSIVVGPTTVLLFNLIDIFTFDPLFVGVIISGVIMLIGYVVNIKRCTKKCK